MIAGGLVKLNRIYNLLLLYSFTFKPTRTRYARWLIIPNIYSLWKKQNCSTNEWVRKKELVIISKKRKDDGKGRAFYLLFTWPIVRLAARICFKSRKTSKVIPRDVINLCFHFIELVKLFQQIIIRMKRKGNERMRKRGWSTFFSSVHLHILVFVWYSINSMRLLFPFSLQL
jgi:hypothetical protein